MAASIRSRNARHEVKVRCILTLWIFDFVYIGKDLSGKPDISFPFIRSQSAFVDVSGMVIGDNGVQRCWVADPISEGPRFPQIRSAMLPRNPSCPRRVGVLQPYGSLHCRRIRMKRSGVFQTSSFHPKCHLKQRPKFRASGMNTQCRRSGEPSKGGQRFQPA